MQCGNEGKEKDNEEEARKEEIEYYRSMKAFRLGLFGGSRTASVLVF